MITVDSIRKITSESIDNDSDSTSKIIDSIDKDPIDRDNVALIWVNVPLVILLIPSI